MHSSSSITVLRGVVYELIFPVLFTHFCDPACRFINPFSVLHLAWQCSQLRVALEERSSEAGMTQCRLVGRALGRWRHGTKVKSKGECKIKRLVQNRKARGKIERSLKTVMLRGAYRETHVTSATRHIPSYNTCSIVPVCICQMMVYGKQTQLGYKKQSK